MDNISRAVAYFKEGFNCAQAIVGVYGEQFGLSREMAFKLACGFGGGMRMAETCGAVTGAFMVIGLKHGQAKAEDNEAKARTHKLVEEFVRKFKSRYGSVVCRALLGCDISTLRGMKEAQERDLFKSVCPRMVATAAEILDEMLT